MKFFVYSYILFFFPMNVVASREGSNNTMLTVVAISHARVNYKSHGCAVILCSITSKFY